MNSLLECRQFWIGERHELIIRHCDKIQARFSIVEELRANPTMFEGFEWRACTVNILIVADNFIYFSEEDFGLSDLINILKNETLSYVRFNITVAHRDNPSDVRIGTGNANIQDGIKNFKFDEPSHFDPAKYHQVWLFGSHRSRKPENASDWSNRLTDNELRVLMTFMG